MAAILAGKVRCLLVLKLVTRFFLSAKHGVYLVGKTNGNMLHNENEIVKEDMKFLIQNGGVLIVLLNSDFDLKV